MNPSETPREFLRRLEEILRGSRDSAPEELESLRREVRTLASAFSALRRFSRLRLSRFVTETAARRRILQYMKFFVGRVLDGPEFEVVSGIHDYPRRIRELRVQEGYRISSGADRDDIRPDQYILESARPDSDEAERWSTANRIRKLPGSGKSRMLALLTAFINRPVTVEQLLYVAKVKDMRRVRELRSEDGWRITTRFTGRPELPPDVYVLESPDQLPPHDRKIPPETYEAVLERDRFKCRKCGWSTDVRRTESKRQFIEVHHVEHHRHGGANNAENLLTLCNLHHDEAHRKRFSPSDLFAWLESDLFP
jgi:hypothetical protein